MPSIASEHRFSNPPFARKRRGSLAVQALSIALVLSAISLVAAPVVAQEDCSYPDDWDDFQWFRGSLERHGMTDDWKPWMLHGAAYLTGNPAIIRLLLDAGADANAVDDGGRTPLHEVAKNNPVVAVHLLAAGADPNALDNDGYTPLHHSAARGENGRVIARLLAAGSDVRAESNDGRTPLHSALRYDAVRDVVSALIQGGGAEGLTPLQLGALQGDTAAVTSLLAEEADPNAVDGYGRSALHFAVPLGGSDVVSVLLAAEADPNAPTVNGLNSLHLAARQAGPAVVSALLVAGADPNAVAGEEEVAGTPLHVATLWSDQPSIALMLLYEGADPGARDENENRPVDRGRVNGAMIGSAAYPRLVATRPTRLVTGRAVTGNLQAGDGVGWSFGYYDEWTYSATAGQRVVITMDSEDVDAYLEVLREDGTQVAWDDDRGTDRSRSECSDVTSARRLDIFRRERSWRLIGATVDAWEDSRARLC